MTHALFQDRASQYGDGIFTTMSVNSGNVALLQRHLHRIERDADRLGIPIDIPDIHRQISQQVEEASIAGVLKLLISSGHGGRGYQRPESMTPQYDFSHHPAPAYYSRWRQSGVVMDISPVKLGAQPMLAGIKHLNRLEQVLVKQHLINDDAIVCDADDCVVEASAANLFWYKGGIWYTPSLQHAGVWGVYRAFLLDYFHAHSMKVQVGRYHVSHLLSAKSVFMCNALMQIIPIKQVLTKGNVVHFSLVPALTLSSDVADSYEKEYDILG